MHAAAGHGLDQAETWIDETGEKKRSNAGRTLAAALLEHSVSWFHGTQVHVQDIIVIANV